MCFCFYLRFTYIEYTLYFILNGNEKLAKLINVK